MGSNMMLMQLIIVTLLIITKLADSRTQPNPGCNSACGDLTDIPFPFGTTPDCYLDESFLITCNTIYNPPRPFLRHGNLHVLSISLDQGLIRIESDISSSCYNQNYDVGNTNVGFSLSKFALSSTLNKFTLVGCAASAIIRAKFEANYSTGCISVCDSKDSLFHGSCDSGVGCCQTTIPQGIRRFQITVQSFGNRSSVQSFNPCIYAFVAEEKAFNFSSFAYLNTTTRMPVVLDWAVQNTTCEEARKNESSYACRSSNSVCIDIQNGPGYRCNCSSGFHGNPYLQYGCSDINECEDANICGDRSICTNIMGSYSCSCLKGYEGDGRNCTKRSKTKGSILLQISLGNVGLER